MFDRILIPYDDSPAASAALEQAILIARRHNSTIHGVNVIDVGLLAMPLAGNDPYRTDLGFEEEMCLEWFQTMRDAAQTLMSSFAARCEEVGVPHTVAIETGNISQILLERARDCDLAVIARSHQPSYDHARLGPVFEALVRHSPVIVWVAHEQPAMPDRAVLAYDGGSHAPDALIAAAEASSVWGVPLELLVVGEGQRVNNDVLERGAAGLRELHAAPQGAHLVAGDPALMILEKTAPDALVVMGTSSHRRPLGFHLDHTLETVVRGARGPLLVCP